MPETELRPPSKLFVGIVESLLPEHDLGAVDVSSSVRIARYVEDQVNALPRKYRWLHAIGMFGFQVLTVLRFARPFGSLTHDRRRAWTNQWAYGSFGLTRQLFRVTRSTTLMASYETPDNGEPLGSVANPSGRTTDRAEIVIIGSGAGGAVTALELARAGHDVLVLEEGTRHAPEAYGRAPTRAMELFYRNRGMTPIAGRVPVGHVEGRCLGGSTEINSGIWHRIQDEVLDNWNAEFDLNVSNAELEKHFDWCEALLRVGNVGSENWPKAAHAFAQGSRSVGYDFQEVRRAAPGCRGTNSCAWGCPTGAKQGMSRSLIPRAESAGARFLSNCRALKLAHEDGRVVGVDVELTRDDGATFKKRVNADHVFVCAGATQSPALLQRSGIRKNVGDSFLIHPFLKVVAKFKDEVNSTNNVFPIIQIKQFSPSITLGGGFFHAGLAAMTLSENWLENATLMREPEKLAIFYVGAQGTGKGHVRAATFGDNAPSLRYDISDGDVRNLSAGLARMSTVLLAGGAESVHPTVYGVPGIRSEADAKRWETEMLPTTDLSLTTVHAFSSCPIGERRERTAADAFGKVHGFENLHISDASVLPTSPGVNPQGIVMALAHRNVDHFLQNGR